MFTREQLEYADKTYGGNNAFKYCLSLLDKNEELEKQNNQLQQSIKNIRKNQEDCMRRIFTIVHVKE